MSFGMFGGLFSSRNEVTAPMPVSFEASPELGLQLEPDRSFEYALDALPVNAMFCDRELILRYLNRSSRKTLHTLQQYLPVPVDEITGKSIHIFHKATQSVDAILGTKDAHGRHKLPYKAAIALGPVKLDLAVEPMLNGRGEYVGAVVLWGVSTQQTIEALKEAQRLQRDDIEHLNANLQMVATATHEIESSIAEIAKNAVEVSHAAEKSRIASVESKAAIAGLHQSSTGVAQVTKLIASIATQTGVLALNANIEAARAGVHGKGFSVVANEVRKLAEHTASATAEIQTKVDAIGEDLMTATAAIDRISGQTEELSGLSQQMAAAAEEQRQATREMAQNLERAAHRASEIANMRIVERVP